MSASSLSSLLHSFSFPCPPCSTASPSPSLHSLPHSLPQSPLSLSCSRPFSPASLDLSPPCPPSPASSSSCASLACSALRVGTFNCGLGFLRKLPDIIARGVQLQLDVIAVQEIGDPAVLDSRFPPYTFIQATGSIHQAGVAFFFFFQLFLAVYVILRAM